MFEEDGVMFKQTITYDPNAKEAVINVPAHLDRISISVVVGEVTTTTVTDTSCVVEDTPADLDVTTEFSKNNPDYFRAEFLKIGTEFFLPKKASFC